MLITMSSLFLGGDNGLSVSAKLLLLFFIIVILKVSRREKEGARLAQSLH